MFTGIIEALGTVVGVERREDNLVLEISSPLGLELRVDQSISHQGVCLTVTRCAGDTHEVVAIRETLQKSNIGALSVGDLVNLERSLTLAQRLDGHLVQGHVDATAICVGMEDKGGSREFRFRFPEAFAHLVIEKGSIALNGISLTVFGVTEDAFSVAIIPYTLENTTMNEIRPGHLVNLEFDLIGKYVSRLKTLWPGWDS